MKFYPIVLSTIHDQKKTELVQLKSPKYGNRLPTSSVPEWIEKTADFRLKPAKTSPKHTPKTAKNTPTAHGIRQMEQIALSGKNNLDYLDRAICSPLHTENTNKEYNQNKHILESETDTPETDFSSSDDQEQNQKRVNQEKDQEQNQEQADHDYVQLFIQLWMTAALKNDFPIKIKSGSNGNIIEYFGDEMRGMIAMYRQVCTPEQLIQAIRWLAEQRTAADDWRHGDNDNFSAGIGFYVGQPELVNCIRAVTSRKAAS